MTNGEKLKYLRNCAMVSQKQLAKAMGVDRRTISTWENNRSPVTDKALNKAKAALKRIVEDPKSIKEKIDTEGCKGCSHWRYLAHYAPTSTRCCHYILDTRKSRGCLPGSMCTRYTTEPIRGDL